MMRKIVKALILIVIVFFFHSSAMAGSPAGDIKAIREAIKADKAEWTAAENRFSGKTLDELKSMLGGSFPSVSPGDRFFQYDGALDLPAEIDWRNNGGNFVTPVRDQDSCGSCWAFAAVAATEARHAVGYNITNPTTDLSEQQVLSCSGGGDCSGGYLSGALDFIRDTGTPDEACFPYSSSDEDCNNRCSDWQDRSSQIESWSWVTTTDYNNTTAIKTALMNGPVPAWFKIYLDFYFYDNGVYEQVWGQYVGNHFVLIVGWNEAEQAWIAKNSWGEDWGEGGYFKIKWGEVEFGSWAADVVITVDCDGCMIDGECYADGTSNPQNNCERCDIALSTEAWSYLGDGESCDDGLFCNGSDHCNAGTCSDPQYPDGNLDCDDGTWCNGMEYCDENSGQCVSAVEQCPDDGLWCNGDESCDEANQECLTTGQRCGDDGSFCNGVETCNEASDQCVSPGNPCIDDGQYCNGTEYCDDSDDQCKNTGDPCTDDGQWCNGNEFCNETADFCDHSLTPGTRCPDDGSWCNGIEFCDESSDSCEHTSSASQTCPADGLWCNGDEYCNELADQCDHTMTPGTRCPDDNQWCNGVEFCDENADNCGHSSTPGQLCPNDGQWCNGDEFCDEAADRCEHTATPQQLCPDDGQWCNGNESCDESKDRCAHSLTPAQRCPNDGTWCNGAESCDEAADSCASTGDPCIEDGLFCNGIVLCDEGADQCTNTGNPCPDDGTFCNGEEICNETDDLCERENLPDCNDEIPCTIDYCDSQIDDCVNATDSCQAVVNPECPSEEPFRSFEIPVRISELDGEQKFGFSLSFDSQKFTYSGFNTRRTITDECIINCENDETDSDLLTCDFYCAVPLELMTDRRLILLQFDYQPQNMEYSDGSTDVHRQMAVNGLYVNGTVTRFEITELYGDFVYFEKDICGFFTDVQNNDPYETDDDDDNNDEYDDDDAFDDDDAQNDDDESENTADDDYDFDMEDPVDIEDICSCG